MLFSFRFHKKIIQKYRPTEELYSMTDAKFENQNSQKTHSRILSLSNKIQVNQYYILIY